MKKQNKEITLKEIFDIFLPKLWIMLLVGILFAGSISVYSVFFKKDTYTCSTKVYVGKTSNTSTVATDIEVALEMVKIYEFAITKADLILDEVANKYQEYNLSVGSIRSMMSVVKEDDTPVLTINVTHTNSNVAYDVAKGISELSPLIPEKFGVNGLMVNVIDPPIETVVPNNKNTTRNAIVAFLAGFVLTMAVIWVFNLFDTVVRSTKKLEDTFDIPVLATIPRHDITTPAKEEEEQK